MLIPSVTKAETPVYLFLGNKEKQSGNYQKAEKYFAKSAAESNDYESWYGLAVTQAYQGKFLEAEKSIKKALIISPQNQDAQLELARIYIWDKKYSAAQEIIDKILIESPANDEAEVLRARIFYHQQQYDQAQKILTPIKQNDETEKLLLDIGSAKKNAAAERLKWSLSYGQSRSKFSRVKQNDWRNSFANLSYKLDSKTVLGFSYENVRRFNDHNHQVGLNANRQFSDKYHGYAGLAYTNNATFLPRWSYKAGGSAKIINNNQFKNINELWLLLDLQYDSYVTTNAKTVKIGLQYYISKSWALTLKHVDIFNHGQYLNGFYSRLDWETPLNGLRLYAGYSHSPETQNAVTIETKSTFGGLAYDINNRITLYTSFAHDDRQNSYIANTASAALAIKF